MIDDSFEYKFTIFEMILIIMGVSGCGKSMIGSLLARELSLPFYDADDFHPESNIKKMKSLNKLSDEDRIPWLYKLVDIINITTKKNDGCILACSALRQSYRNILEENTSKNIHYIFLKGSYELILTRFQSREGHFMPEKLLKSQFETLEEPEGCITISVDNKPHKIIEEIMQELSIRNTFE